MVSRIFVARGNKNRRANTVVTFLGHCLLAIMFIAGGGCSAGGGGESSPPAVQNQPAPIVASISLTPSGASLQVGQTQQFTATALDAGGNTIPGVPFTWSSNEPVIASVSSSGVVTGLAGGGTLITASGGGATSAPATVTVTVAPPVVTSVTLTPTGASLQVGQTQQFTATAKDAGGNTIPGVIFTWSSNEPLVASVSSSGVVTGLAGGGTLITASGGGRTSAPATVTVTVAAPVVTSITLTPSGASLQVGQTQQFTATALDAGGNTIPGVPFTWSSNVPQVASVSSNGVVTGLAGGGTLITASGGGRTSAPATVTVTVAAPVVTSITLTPSGASLQVGQTQQFTATARDTFGNVVPNVTFTWTSSNQAVASINSNGLATGLVAGSTIVGATVGSISTGTTLAVTAGGGGGGGGGGSRSYSTSFDQNENPISEVGQWLNGASVGLDWMNIRTQSGVAYGTRTSEPGDAIDPTAILTGTWGWNQTAQATLLVTSGGSLKEAEIRLNSSMSAHVCNGYEILYEVTGTIAIVRWNGPLANYTFLASTVNIPGRAGVGGLITGDVLKATNVNGTITAYLNDVQIAQATDTTYQAGAPGFGLNTYGGADPTTYGFSSFTASSN